MSTITKVAEAFAAGIPAKCHNSATDGNVYILHGHIIAIREAAQRFSFNWCGWHTPTTANHLNHIARALKANTRFSYAQARDGKAERIGYFA